MKKIIILFIVVLLIPILAYTQSQIIESVEFISPFNDEVAAIKKEGQWAFINLDGDIVINFRTDFISTQNDDGTYPVFHSNRCMIVKEKNGILYFGYIDKTGKTVIEPQFLNATNFIDDIAIALQLVKQEVGNNQILNKNIVYYRSFEVTIDTKGEIKNYINPKGLNVTLDKKFLSKPPKINSKLLSKNLVATKNDNKNWSIIKIY